jgi:carboxymethylenebutenolidase
MSALAPFTLQQIGTDTARFPSGVAIPTPTDAAVDPYIKTRMSKDVQVEAIQFWPQEKGTYPGLVLIHEWWGLNSQIKELGWRAKGTASSFPICMPVSGAWSRPIQKSLRR